MIFCSTICRPARPSRLALPLALLSGVLLLGTAIGCTDVPERTGDTRTDLRSSDPLVRGETALQAGRNRDEAAVPQLIDLLLDKEYGVRLNAHMALILITGRSDFGYLALDPPASRSAAAKRWREWYATIQPAPER